MSLHAPHLALIAIRPPSKATSCRCKSFIGAVSFTSPAHVADCERVQAACIGAASFTIAHVTDCEFCKTAFV